MLKPRLLTGKLEPMPLSQVPYRPALVAPLDALALLRADLRHAEQRRSVRRFSEEPVPRAVIEEARRILRFSPLGATKTIEKALNSAVANAEQQPGVVAQNLVVDRAWVDEGPTLKRWRPRAYGRATKILKRTSHITLVVRSLGEDA